jgi:hypothetical protein
VEDVGGDINGSGEPYCSECGEEVSREDIAKQIEKANK